ncbi:MAG: hypothetical protein HYV16_14765 [Gammaproteobacteria bacterium]|nr:hypothetical protein [Gammaproteobacteria bacterium]
MNSLKKLLAANLPVAGTSQEVKLKNLTDMTNAAARRQGYTDDSGCWTDKGWNRATSVDLDRIGKANEAFNSNK